MLTLIPKHWYSWDFRLQDETGVAAAEVILSCWRERGSIIAAGEEYRVVRRGMTGPFVLELGNVEVARAFKVSAFRQEFTVSCHGINYTLKRLSWWRSKFGVFVAGDQVGAITPETWWSRRARVTLPSMRVPVQAFFVWLAALMWKRDSDAGAVGSPGS